MATTNYVTTHGRIRGEITNGVMTRYGTDSLGSVVATYSGGAVQNTYRFKPYGGMLSKTGTATYPSFLWNGGSGYKATGLSGSDYYVRNRVFSLTAGRWTSVDLLWPSERAYAYLKGAPTLVSDSSGLSTSGGSTGAPSGNLGQLDRRAVHEGADAYYATISAALTLPTNCQMQASATVPWTAIQFYIGFAGTDPTESLAGQCGVQFSCKPGVEYGWSVFSTYRVPAVGGYISNSKKNTLQRKELWPGAEPDRNFYMVTDRSGRHELSSRNRRSSTGPSSTDSEKYYAETHGGLHY